MPRQWQPWLVVSGASSVIDIWTGKLRNVDKTVLSAHECRVLRGQASAPEITLVADQHDDDVGVSVVPQLL